MWKLAHESKSKNMAEINISPVAVAQFVDGIVHCRRIKYINFVHLDGMVGVVNFTAVTQINVCNKPVT